VKDTEMGKGAFCKAWSTLTRVMPSHAGEILHDPLAQTTSCQAAISSPSLLLSEILGCAASVLGKQLQISCLHLAVTGKGAWYAALPPLSCEIFVVGQGWLVPLTPQTTIALPTSLRPSVVFNPGIGAGHQQRLQGRATCRAV